MSNPTPRVFRVYALHAGDYHFRYVGLTDGSLKARLGSHKRDKRKNKLFVEWKQQHRSSLRIVELETCSDAVADVAEATWISVLKEAGHELLNLQTGGRTGWLPEPDFQRRMSENAKKLRHTEATKRRLSEAFKGRPIPQEQRDRISATLTGRPGHIPSEETKKLIAASVKAHPNNAKQRAYGLHVRWHVKRGLTKPGCEFCV